MDKPFLVSLTGSVGLEINFTELVSNQIPYIYVLINLNPIQINFSLFSAKIPLDQVMERLRTTRGGLSSEEVASRLLVFGLNKLDEKQVNRLWKFLRFM